MSAPLSRRRAAPLGTPATGPTASGSGPPAVPASTSVGATEPSAQRSGYEHLAPLFAEHAGLPDGHPRRDQLGTRLIEEHRPVARHIARKYRHRGENPEDLDQVAVLGLILAAAADIAQSNGRAARPSEIARKLGVDVDVVLEGLAAQGTARTSSLDEPARDVDGGPGDRGRHDAVLGRVEPEFDLVEHREGLAPLLAALPERERRIVLMRFSGEMTQTEIGQQVGISQMHVSRLLSRTLRSLRSDLAES